MLPYAVRSSAEMPGILLEANFLELPEDVAVLGRALPMGRKAYPSMVSPGSAGPNSTKQLSHTVAFLPA
jgi:hypothetical protein